MDHQTYEEWISAYAFGVLADDERRMLEEHLKTGCETCKHLLLDFQEAANTFNSGMSGGGPASETKDRLLARVREHRDQQLRRWAYLRLLWPLPWVAAAVFVLWLVGGSLKTLRQSGAAGAELIPLAGSVLVDGKPAGSLPLPSKGEVSTGPGGDALLVWSNHAAVEMGPETRLQLRPGAASLGLRLRAGTVWMLLEPGVLCRLDAPLASLQAGPAALRVQAAPSGTSFCLFDGHLAVFTGRLRFEPPSAPWRAYTLRREDGQVALHESAGPVAMDPALARLRERLRARRE